MRFIMPCPFCEADLIFNYNKDHWYCPSCLKSGNEKYFVDLIIKLDRLSEFCRIKDSIIIEEDKSSCAGSKRIKNIVVSIFKKVEQEYNQRRCLQSVD